MCHNIGCGESGEDGMKVDGVAMGHLVFAGMLLLTLPMFFAIGGLGSVIGGLLGAFALAHLVGGVGLLQRYGWARWLALGVALMQLFNVPLGTALGGITLAVLADASSLDTPASAPGMRLLRGVGALLFGAVGVPLLFLLGVGALMGFMWLLMPQRDVTPDEQAAICQLSDLPFQLQGIEESHEAMGNAFWYEGTADGVAMTTWALLSTERSEDADVDQTHLSLDDDYIGLRDNISFEQRSGVPFGADAGHWAAGLGKPGVAVGMAHGPLSLNVWVVGAEPQDLPELEAWLARCVSDLQALGEEVE
ncbi:MAG: hypothetical protein ACI9K2_006677 [Myxococcota bacterium]|jgi:hypothetical protein